MKYTKHIICSILLSGIIYNSCSNEVSNDKSLPQTYEEFTKVSITNITPKGWLKEFLVRQKEGLTGNIDVAGYPYNTCMWACEKMKGSTKAWWPYEQTAYYLDGVHRLGLLLNDNELIQKATVNTDYVSQHVLPTGRFGTNLADRWWRWPYASFNRLYMTQYEITESDSIVELLKNHYLTFKAEDFQDDLDLANVEQLCWLYKNTGKKEFLNMAEKAYQLFKSNPENKSRAGKKQTPSDIQFGTDRKPDHHGVVYLELAKIPTLLYQCTGNETYLEEAENALAKMEKHFMMVNGLPSTTEHFEDISETAGFEVCNTATLPYTYGELLRTNGDSKLADKIEKAVFNGAMGAITKDFKAHQYFSEANQVIASQNSNRHGHHPARMAFLPGHDVECCTGNVNRFMPYYVEQMWLKTKDGNGIVAALYGPCSIEMVLADTSKKVTINQETFYPFADEITFTFSLDGSANFPFIFRVPKWTDAPTVSFNGEKLEMSLNPGEFARVDKVISDGDIIMLKFPMKIKTTEWPHDGVAIERGPLVYSLPIKYQKEIVEKYDKSTEEFPGYNITAIEDWQYGIIADDLADLRLVETMKNGYPWDEGNSPLKILAKAKKINNWNFNKNYDDHHKTELILTPSFPSHLETKGEPIDIELVPYGNTILRMTVFPSIANNN